MNGKTRPNTKAGVVVAVCARPGCGRDVQLTKSWRRYCSTRCRIAAYWLRVVEKESR